MGPNDNAYNVIMMITDASDDDYNKLVKVSPSPSGRHCAHISTFQANMMWQRQEQGMLRGSRVLALLEPCPSHLPINGLL